MSAKVGECTCVFTPSPRARPLTNSVLPAPRSPVSPITMPMLAAFPHDSPRARVSSGLLEMNVAMSSQWLNTSFVANPQTGLGRDFADASQTQAAELAFPCIEHSHRVFARNGEEQFKILPVAQRCQQRRF